MTRCGPKGNLSPTLGDPCAVCGLPLAAGDYTTLVPGPGAGRYANGVEAHWDCAVRRLRAALQ